MTRLWIAVVLLLSVACAGKQAGSTAGTAEPAAPAAPATFAAQAAALGLTFQAPAGYTEVPIRKNFDVAYDHAVQSADQRIEMRFALRPYPDNMPAPARTREFSWTFFETAIMNLTHGGKTGESTAAEALHLDEFGADDARIVVIRFYETNNQPEHFGNGYELCVAIFMHRDGVGDAYTFVLFKDPEATKLIDEAAMHSLRFAKK